MKAAAPAPAPAAPLLWDIFCHVIDNWGDLGVCWRLARQLVAHRQRVRLWVDDASALSWMASPGALQGPGPSPRSSPSQASTSAQPLYQGLGELAELSVHHWPRLQPETAPPTLEPGDVLIEADVATEVGAVLAVAEATAKTLAAHGKIDILVNNAGITGGNMPSWEIPVAQWRRVMEVNLNAPFIVASAVVPHLLANGWGRIVNVASVAGKEGNPNAAHYSASKAGLIGYTKSLAKELAQKGVLVNCVTPAAVKTAIFDQMTPEHIQFMLGKIPMGRFGTPDEVAALVAWLCTEDCSFSTGAVFDLSDGRATY